MNAMKFLMAKYSKLINKINRTGIPPINNLNMQTICLTNCSHPAIVLFIKGWEQHFDKAFYHELALQTSQAQRKSHTSHRKERG
jgi:hypothetical protein